MSIGKICPKCQYQRKPGDDDYCPAYECPKCGVVYANAAAAKKKAAPVIREPVKIHPEQKSGFSRLFGKHRGWIVAAAIVLAVATGGYFLFFSPQDLYYQARDGSIQPAGRTLEAFITDLEKAYELKSYQDLVGGGGKLVVGANRSFRPTEIMSMASPGRFTIWFKKEHGVSGLVAYKVLFAPAPAESIIGNYQSIPERPVDTSIVKTLYPPFLLKLWGKFPTLRQKRLHVRLLDTSALKIAAADKQAENTAKANRDPGATPPAARAANKRQAKAREQALAKMKLAGNQQD